MYTLVPYALVSRRAQGTRQSDSTPQKSWGKLGPVPSLLRLLRGDTPVTEFAAQGRLTFRRGRLARP